VVNFVASLVHVRLADPANQARAARAWNNECRSVSKQSAFAFTSTSTTVCYYAGNLRVAEATNGTFSYLGSDGLGSAEVALDGSGNVQASELYDPYGNGRYSSGTMPRSYGYTGQQADATTGLDDYQARYYDAVAGQFTSADSVQDGLNRYAYVAGNPETAADPSGHKAVECAGDCGSGPPPCTSNCPPTTLSCTGSCLPGSGQKAGPDANAIRAAWTTYFDALRLSVQVILDKVQIVLDVGFLITDIALAVAGVGLAVLSVITDVLALAADIDQFIQDDSPADGNAANAKGASQWSGVFNTLSIIGQIINVGAGILTLWSGWKEIVEKGAKEVIGRIVGMLFSTEQGKTAVTNLSLIGIENQEQQVESMTDAQIIKLGLPPSSR
jgi:RHS repeat-associated protein